jgi:transcriptional regulator with XRE-family HTH domain
MIKFRKGNKLNFFGEQIKKEMEIAKLSVSELSEKTGLSEDVIMKIAEGSLFPNVNHLMSLSKAFGKHQGYFFTKLVLNK